MQLTGVSESAEVANSANTPIERGSSVFQKEGCIGIVPVFSILVAGHRQARLDRHWLAADDRDQRAIALQALLSQQVRLIRDQAEACFESTDQIYAHVAPDYRIITGLASGVDQLARECAQSSDLSLHLLAPQIVNESDLPPHTIDRGVAIGMQPWHHTDELSDTEFELRDHLALSFSDLLLAVWDDAEGDQIQSGTARMVKDALLRRKPVILLRLEASRSKPVLMIADPQRLTDTWIAQMRVMGADTNTLLQVFCEEEPGSDPANNRLQEWISNILLPFEAGLDQDNRERQLISRIEKQKPLLQYVGQWLFWCLSLTRLFSQPRRRPISLYEWIQGSWLWFGMMFNPPTKSQPFRIVECLSTETRTFSRREEFVSRAHGFFSNLARLDIKQAIDSLRYPPCSRGYQSIKPGTTISDQHPIQEPDLEEVFNWSDTMARLFATRYRDDTWMIYYAAAFAVFCAVAGAIHLWPASDTGLPYIWVFLEFFLLHFIVRRVLKARYRDYHGRWMGFRFLAEQLRYLRLGYPLLVLPRSFVDPIWAPAKTSEQKAGMQLISAESWILQRVLIAEGLPRDAQGKKIYTLTQHNSSVLSYVREVLEEHRQYFYRSYHHLHRNHASLHRLAFVLFSLTFIAVTIHFFVSLPGILIFTAFFPAWGAAIHGILTQNEVSRVSSMATSVWQQLTTLLEALDIHEQKMEADMQTSATSDWAETHTLREMVSVASEVLCDENRYWHQLFQPKTPELPG
ncbi:hypothetical protein [Nitrincola sp. MINF-07-Sa-05]|uniref:hypothetical protein n=1 Tax=Nitrincola salilacus TaxID=3400273 RepID=UPI0039183393